MASQYATERPDTVTWDWNRFIGQDNEMTRESAYAECLGYVTEANTPTYSLADALTEFTIDHIASNFAERYAWETLEYLADGMFTDILNAGHSPLVGYVQNVGMIE